MNMKTRGLIGMYSHRACNDLSGFAGFDIREGCICKSLQARRLDRSRESPQQQNQQGENSSGQGTEADEVFSFENLISPKFEQ
jgi:hypothetical protein